MRRLLLTGLLLAAATADAGEAGPAREALEKFSSGLDTLHATFTQRVIANDGRLDSEGDGAVWLQAPNLFRWSYEGEYPELIVADGARVWIYDELLEQVTVKPQSKEAEDSPLLLLTRPESLEAQFTVTELGEFEDMQLLSLVSMDAESEFERVMLGFEGSRLRLMALEDAFGIRTEIRFEGLQRNQDLDADLFRFVPPEGVDVVGDTGLNESP